MKKKSLLASLLIFAAGLLLIVAAGILGFMFANPAIGEICLTISRGAIFKRTVCAPR